MEAAGYPDRTRRAQLRRLEEHHKRVHRHARTEALIEGITALETVYRDALAGGAVPALNADRPALGHRRRGVRAWHSMPVAKLARRSSSTTPTRA